MLPLTKFSHRPFFVSPWNLFVWSAAIAVVGATLLLSRPSHAAGRLIKAEHHPAVYYLDDDSRRHPFPTTTTYRSWYGDGFSRVESINAEALAKIPLGRNITLKPGKWLVKVPSAPTVYAVEAGGVLRPIATAEVAAAIFGSGWARRVVDLPEVFFENYSIGAPLTKTYELPGSVVYQVQGAPTYYWKQDVLLQPFSSFADVEQNGYRREDVVVSPRILPTRARPVRGESATVSNPLAAPRRSTQDCGGIRVRAALILVTRDESTADVDVMRQLAARLPETYRWATRELGSLTVDGPVVIADDGYLSRATEQGGRKLTEEVVLTFYDQHPDAYDLLLLFTDFPLQQDDPSHQARHVLVTNAIEGLGLPLQNAAALFGSQGKLKGVVVVGDVRRFDLAAETGWLQLDDLLLHEVGHQWSGSVKFRVGPEEDSVGLLRPDGRHWSYYAGFVSPLGGSGWRDNGDGTFSSRLALESALIRRPYSDLDLYLMGLLPALAVDPFFYLEPTMPGAAGNTLRGVARSVTVQQVIMASGPRSCALATFER